MPRNLLNDTQLRALKPAAKSARLSDGEGLYLLTSVNGGSHGWRFDYTSPSSRKRKTLSLGTYPNISLSVARRKRDEARELLAQDIDPSDARRQKKAAVQAANEDTQRKAAGLPALDSFEAVARRWFSVKRDSWAEKYSDKVIRRLETKVFPFIGDTPISEITAPQVLLLLRKIEAQGIVETAH